MTEAELVQILRGYVDTLFPKTCAACGRRYESVRDYIQRTTRAGRVVSYDLELGDFQPAIPLGSHALSHCACGSTLDTSTNGLPHAQRLAMLAWVKEEIDRRHVDATVILDEIRDKLRALILTEPGGSA